MTPGRHRWDGAGARQRIDPGDIFKGRGSHLPSHVPRSSLSTSSKTGGSACASDFNRFEHFESISQSASVCAPRTQGTTAVSNLVVVLLCALELAGTATKRSGFWRSRVFREHGPSGMNGRLFVELDSTDSCSGGVCVAGLVRTMRRAP